jgi:hypothetical protein
MLAGEPEFVFQLIGGDPHPMSYLRIELSVPMCVAPGATGQDDLSRPAQAYPLDGAPADAHSSPVRSILPASRGSHSQRRPVAGARSSTSFRRRVSPRARGAGRKLGAPCTSSHWLTEYLRLLALTGWRTAAIFPTGAHDPPHRIGCCNWAAFNRQLDHDRRPLMTTETHRDRKLPPPNDDAVRMLTDILNQVRSGFHARPLSPEAEAAVAKYNDLRRTLDLNAVKHAGPSASHLGGPPCSILHQSLGMPLRTCPICIRHPRSAAQAAGTSRSAAPPGWLAADNRRVPGRPDRCSIRSSLPGSARSPARASSMCRCSTADPRRRPSGHQAVTGRWQLLISPTDREHAGARGVTARARQLPAR